MKSWSYYQRKQKKRPLVIAIGMKVARTRKTRSTFIFRWESKSETESKYGSKVNLRMVYVTYKVFQA